MLITDHSSVSENAAWQIIRDGYDAADETNLETVFTLSNGYSHVFLPIEKVRPQVILQINSGGKLKRSDPQMQSCSPVEAVFSTVNLDADGVCLQWDMSDAQENTQNLLNTHGRSIYHPQLHRLDAVTRMSERQPSCRRLRQFSQSIDAESEER